MPISVTVAPQFSGRVKRDRLREAAVKALQAEQVEDGRSLTIVVTDNKSIRELNRRFQHVNTPTDVLSFSSDEQGYLGDVVISYETARENARKAGWAIVSELELLVVHGVLHLLGYDDTKPRLREEMWQKQAEILGPIPKPH